MNKKELQIKVESLLKEKHLTKVGLADALGIPKQNVHRIFNVQKMPQMAVVAEYLGVQLDELLYVDVNEKNHQPQIDGFVEINEQIYRIKSLDDLLNIAEIVKTSNS